MRVYAGIDNGLDGAISLVGDDGSIVGLYPTPTLADGKGRIIDIQRVWEILKPYHDENCLVVLLEPASKHSPGKMALCSTWFTYGHIKALLVIKKIRYELIQPQKWQKEFWVRPKLAGDQKFDTKAAALTAAKKLWPDEKFVASKRCTVAHNGIVDAVLIAEYGRRKNL